MRRHLARLHALAVGGALVAATTAAQADGRLVALPYAGDRVVDVPVKRGIVTLIELASDEQISTVATGQGADCEQPAAQWCVAAPAGGRRLFVKPRAPAQGPNNLTVVTDRRVHVFRLLPMTERDKREPVYRLTVLAPPDKSATRPATALPLPLPELPPLRPADPATVAERLQAAPEVVNTLYSAAEGEHAADILPTLVFDDGRFTYLRFANNREVPAVFHVQRDGTETLVNTRMEGDLLVVDRVSRRLNLRAGSAVVGLWNEAFDVDGQPPVLGTTVPGVAREVRGLQEAQP